MNNYAQPQGYTADGLGMTEKQLDEEKGRLAVHKKLFESESRASQLSTVERRIVKQANICQECRLNEDPNNVPVHPNCDCNVVTDSITTGVADPRSRFLGTLTHEVMDMQVIGELESAGIQLDPGSIAIMDAENVRFSDFARWLESVQPYLDTGAQYITIISDTDTNEAVAQVQETVQSITEGSADLAEAIKSRKLWFSIAKAVAI